MVVKHRISDYKKFTDFLEGYKETEKLLILFEGSTQEKGESWCPDCVRAAPYIESAIKKNQDKNFNYVRVFVGDREEWRDPNNPFRKDPRFLLTCIPTCLVYGTDQRINDEECRSAEKVAELFKHIVD